MVRALQFFCRVVGGAVLQPGDATGAGGTAMALQTIVSTLLGIGVGPLLAGLLSDALQPAFGTESLRYALLLVRLPVVGSVGLLIRTAGHAAQTHYVHAPQRA